MIQPQIEDPALQQQVQNAIVGSPYLSQNNLQCETESGRVVLRGKVSSFFQKQMAQEALRRIDGVEQIENLLEVRRRTNA